MPPTVQATRTIEVSVQPQSKVINVTVTPSKDAPKVVQVQPNTIKGPRGDSPVISVYNAAAIMPVNGVLSIDASEATSIYAILTQDITDIEITNWPPLHKTQRIAVYLQQDTTGFRVVQKWPDNSKWSNGQQPELSARPGAIDCVVFDTFNSGQTVFASFVGQDYS